MQALKKYLPKEFIPIKTQIHQIECAQSWSQLTKTEKLYAYYLARASWEGAKICWFQRSYESPALLVLLKLIFSQNLESLREKALAKQLTDDEWRQMLAYSAAVFDNHGNYKSFGDSKFVPELESEKFKVVVESSDSYQTHKEVIDNILGLIEDVIYSEGEPNHIGFPDKNGQTSYYSSNVTSDESSRIDQFCQSQKISPLNTRLFKLGDNEFELKIASLRSDASKTPYLKTYEWEDLKIHVTASDFSDIMGQVVSNLEKAYHYTANDNQRNMVRDYIEHFRFGDIEKHKDSQRHWIKDVGPIVESDIGFIETYLDPSGARAEFEGFVAVVDKVTSEKFNQLVKDAEHLISFLPWGKEFEKDKFSKPDFTNLDVLAFACSGVPIGINIPNYDDIRMNEGFKNVNLGNAYPRAKSTNIKFLKQSDVDLMVKYDKESLTLIVALHELLGHGTGKLFVKNVETGEVNFDENMKHPFNDGNITTFYLSTETWSQKFGKLHSGYEECRADTVALYLMHFKEPFQIFFPDRQAEWDDMYYVGWLDMLMGGIKGLEYFQPEGKVWGQAHVLASYVIFAVVREADPTLVQFEFTTKDDQEYFFIHFDREKLRTTGFEAIKEFLRKLHILKSIGDFDEAKKMFDHYSEVDETLLKVRELVIKHKIPRRLTMQPNLFLNHETGEPFYKDYEDSFEGFIKSACERYPDPFQEEVYRQWLLDVPHLKRHKI